MRKFQEAGETYIALGDFLDGLHGIAAEMDFADDDTEPDDRDWRLKGEPGTINEDGYKETLIGSDGRAIRERHHTEHTPNGIHTNPHDHEIEWTPDGKPVFGPPINYPDGNPPPLQ